MREIVLKKVLERVKADMHNKNSVLLVDDEGDILYFDQPYQVFWYGIGPERYREYSASSSVERSVKHFQKIIRLAGEEGYKNFAFFLDSDGDLAMEAFTVATSKREGKKQAETMDRSSVIGLSTNEILDAHEEFSNTRP